MKNVWLSANLKLLLVLLRCSKNTGPILLNYAPLHNPCSEKVAISIILGGPPQVLNVENKTIAHVPMFLESLYFHMYALLAARRVMLRNGDVDFVVVQDYGSNLVKNTKITAAKCQPIMLRNNYTDVYFMWYGTHIGQV